MVNAKLTVRRGDNNTETTIVDEQLTHDIPISLIKTIDNSTQTWFSSIIKAGGVPPPPPPNKPPVINTNTSITGKINQEVTLMANITDPDGILEDVSWKQTSGADLGILPRVEELNGMYKTKFTPTVAGTFVIQVEAFDNQNGTSSKDITIQIDQITPPPPPGVLYDSHVNSKLHDGIERTITKEGNIGPNGLGVECRASGSPRIQVNADGTFSLLDDDLGRFYGYVCNYNATLVMECAFWTSGKQTLSLKLRSRHNESGEKCDGGSPIDGNRFGGYGFAVKASSWDAKREPTHNCHDQSSSGSISPSIAVKQYFTVEFTVKDDGNGGVKQIGKVNGKTLLDKTDSNPKPFMVDKALYDAQSYYWVRQNTSTLAELRIKSLKILKA